MRSILLAAIPALAALTVSPVEGQVSARFHIDIPVGRQHPVVARARRAIMVRDYDARRYGEWESYYDQWIPETVYLYDGQYYDYPVVEYATPIVVYRYRNEIFRAPATRGFVQWRQTYRPQNRYRPQVIARRPSPGDGHDQYNGRDRNQYRGAQPGREDHGQYRGGQSGRAGQGQYQAAPGRAAGNRSYAPSRPPAGHGQSRAGNAHRSHARP